MSKLWRALLISAVATGVAAVVLKVLEPEPPAPERPGPHGEVDQMSEEQVDLLLRELEAQV